MTRRALGGHLGLEQTAVGDLYRKGVVTAEMTLAQARLAYLAHLREQAAGRRGEAADGQVLDLVAERARLAAAQADGQLHRNALAVRQSIPVDEVKWAWANMTMNFKEKVRAVHVVAMTRVPNFTAEQARALKVLTDEACVELADGVPKPRKQVMKPPKMRVATSEETPPEAA